MKPFMKQKVTAEFVEMDANGNPVTDKYGRPKTSKQSSKARVQIRSQVIFDRNGIERNVFAEIDLPPEFNPPEGATIEYTTAGGDTGKGRIAAKEEIANLSGSRVYYRTVFVDG